MAWLPLAMLILEIVKLIMELFRKKNSVVAAACTLEMNEAIKSKDWPRLHALRDRLKAGNC